MIILLGICIVVEPVSGVLSTVAFNIIYYISYQIWKGHRNDTVFLFGLSHFWFITALQALSWITQVSGHTFFEKRNALFLPNRLSVFVSPSYFVVDMLYYFGYNRKTIDECQLVIDKDISEYKKAQAKLKQK